MSKNLFRGKCKLGDKSWVYGNLLTFNEGINPVAYIIGSFDCPDIADLHEYIEENLHLIDINTVGQYTGRLDRNYKPIFEGDIVDIYSLVDNRCYHRGWVGWNEISGSYLIYEILKSTNYVVGEFAFYDKFEYYEVIGNIHDLNERNFNE